MKFLTPACLSLVASAVLPATANVFIEANLFQSHEYFGTDGTSYYAFFSAGTDDPNIESISLVNANGSLTGGSGGAGSGLWTDWDGLFGALEQNPWTMTIDYGDTEETYTFNVSVVDPTLPGGVQVTNPLDGATDVAPDVEFKWQRNSPITSFDSMGVDVVPNWSSRPTYPELPPDTDTTWSSHGGLAGGEQHFVVQYRRTTEFFEYEMTTPMDGSGNSLADFSYSFVMNDEASALFTAVPEPETWASLAALGLAGLALARRRGARPV
jgi:hypothetical protein